jgi:hypothetical protein
MFFISFLAVFIRGLNEAFVRNQADWDFQVLIHSYIDVQVCHHSLDILMINSTNPFSTTHCLILPGTAMPMQSIGMALRPRLQHGVS